MIEAQILLNPRMPKDQQDFIRKKIPIDDFPEHFWIASSGSTAKSQYDHKFAALSKTAVLTSAASVNKHLEASSKDIWLTALPSFHVGGLGILARAYLSNSEVISLNKWDPHHFHSLIKQKAVSLTSLVPAQVFDLVANKLPAPKSIRAIIVGGGALSPTLLREAKLLGWPLLPSYGLTECASQVATAETGFERLSILKHIEIRCINGKIALKSPALLTTYAFLTESKITVVDPKIDGWFLTQDCGEIVDGYLIMLGREDDFIKIGGESVMLSRLNELFEKAKLVAFTDFDAVIFPMTDERLGHVIHLASTSNEYEKLVAIYNQHVLPFERIRKVHIVSEIPRSPLKKVLMNQLYLECGDLSPL